MPDHATLTITLSRTAYLTLLKELDRAENRLEYQIPKAEIATQPYLRKRLSALQHARHELVQHQDLA